MKINTKDWEQKIINNKDFLSEVDLYERKFSSIIPIKYREWLLGGRKMEWRYQKDLTNGNIILERR